MEDAILSKKSSDPLCARDKPGGTFSGDSHNGWLAVRKFDLASVLLSRHSPPSFNIAAANRRALRRTRRSVAAASAGCQYAPSSFCPVALLHAATNGQLGYRTKTNEEEFRW